MSPPRVFHKLALAVSALILFTATSAKADPIVITGVGSGQFSTASSACEFNSQTNTLTFTITNTSAISQPGSTSTITGIGFDLPPRGNASDSGLNGFTGMQAPSLTSNFTFSDADLGTVPAGFGVPPAVVLDFGFITGSNFAGGMVAEGLLPGESASFTVSGVGFTGFTEEQICNAIYVRFQNVPAEGGSGGSDVGVPTTSEVPEPASLLLMATGLVGVAGVVRRRKLRTRN